MIINGKKSSQFKTDSEKNYYFSILKSILFELETKCSFIEHIKPQSSKTTDSLYAMVYFKKQAKVLKLTIRNHRKEAKEGEYRYYLDNFTNSTELLLTLLRDFEYVYQSLNTTGEIPQQKFAKEKYNNSASNRKLSTVLNKKKRLLNKRRRK